MSHVRLSARAQSDLSRLQTSLANKDTNAAKRAMLVIREAFMPLTHAPKIGRPMEYSDGLPELVIDFGASGYLALYRFEPTLDAVTILAIKHQREDDYK
jgi:plasmid stabilization system protein ParE